MSAQHHDRRPDCLVTAVVLLTLAGLLRAAPAQGQITPPPRPPLPGAVVKPPPNLQQLPLPDLRVTSVQFVRHTTVAYPAQDVTVDTLHRPFWLEAVVTITNAGVAAATLPGNRTQVSTESPEPARRFSGVPTGIPLTLNPGESKEVRLNGPQPCKPGRGSGFTPLTPGPVTFRVDSANSVAESNETNNGLTVTPPWPDYSYADLVPVTGYLIAGTRTIRVDHTNVGTMPALICPGTGLWKFVEGPPSALIGGPIWVDQSANPRGWSYEPFLIRNNEIVKMQMLTGTPEQLPAGTYLFKVQLNPRSLIPERNTGNNTLTMTVTIP